MNTRNWPSLASVSLLAVLLPPVLSGSAHADSIETHLTAENIEGQSLSFKIGVKEVKPLKEFTITVKRKKGRLSPFLEGSLSLYDGENHVASCRIKGIRDKDEVIYSFQVAPKYLDKSKFTFWEMGHANGIAMPSGDFFWFSLKEFASGWKDGGEGAGKVLGTGKGAVGANAILEEEAVRLLFRRERARMDGTEPPASWPEKVRRVGSAWVVDIDTSRLPGGYPEQIVIDVTGTGGHSGIPKR